MRNGLVWSSWEQNIYWRQCTKSIYIGINAISGMVTTNQVNLEQVCSLNIEQSRLLQNWHQFDHRHTQAEKRNGPTFPLTLSFLLPLHCEGGPFVIVRRSIIDFINTSHIPCNLIKIYIYCKLHTWQGQIGASRFHWPTCFWNFSSQAGTQSRQGRAKCTIHILTVQFDLNLLQIARPIRGMSTNEDSSCDANGQYIL